MELDSSGPGSLAWLCFFVESGATPSLQSSRLASASSRGNTRAHAQQRVPCPGKQLNLSARCSPAFDVAFQWAA